ncbi:hypothetical protein C6P42_001243 [Pichia californica]|nr:hypothetical protein C6P42_001243 [[Candida] californica]
MSEEIPYIDRYIYNLNPTILDSLQTLYFDSQTFQQKTKEEFLKRRKDEIEERKSEIQSENTKFINPIIIQPKPRNAGTIAIALSKLKISKSEDNTTNGDKKDVNNETENLSSEVEISESEDDLSEDDKNNSELPIINEINDDYESTISFMTTKSPMILFNSSILSTESSGKCFGVYKTTLNAIDSPNFDPLSVLKSITFTTENPIPKDPIESGISAIFMLSSGHFAGAIISHLPHSTKGNKGSSAELQLQSVRLLAHKTFHRYTTRRKQGGSQSAMDDAKGKANSAGSTLRRYNEQALGKDIEILMEEWKPFLEQCSSIFIRGSGKGGKNARGIGLIVRDPKDPKAIIKTDDKRVKMLPFATKRPTITEIKNAWCELSYLKIVDVPVIEKGEIEKRRKKDEMLNKSKEDKKNEIDDVQIKISNEIILLLKKSKAPALISYMKKNKDKFNVESELQPIETFRLTPTLLHYASKKGYSFMVQTLLVQLHADPTIINSIGKTAYDVASDMDTRYAFRVARGILGEDCGIPWSKSHIGKSMNKDDVENAKSEAKAEEARIEEEEKKALKEEHQSVVEEFKNKESSKSSAGKTITGPGVLRVTEEQKLSGLSDMQRMKVLREQRFRAIEARLKKQQE